MQIALAGCHPQSKQQEPCNRESLPISLLDKVCHLLADRSNPERIRVRPDSFYTLHERTSAVDGILGKQVLDVRVVHQERRRAQGQHLPVESDGLLSQLLRVANCNAY
jgi:hypothetical protein